MDKPECVWNLVDVLSQDVHCNKHIVKNVVKLLDDDNTIPFIARYRQQQTAFMPVGKLREVKEKYEELKDLRKSISNIIVKLEKQNKLDQNLRRSFLQAQDSQTVDELYAPLKLSKKTSFVNQARALGLGPVAERILKNNPNNSFDLITNLIDISVDGLKTFSEVETGIINIIRDIISKDPDIISHLYPMFFKYDVKLTCIQNKMNKENDKFLSHVKKFEFYLNFANRLDFILPHQILAINRAEKLEIIKVKLHIPDIIKDKYIDFIKIFYKFKDLDNDYTKQLIINSAEQAYTKYLIPNITRRIRRELSSKAEQESIEVFGSNLKNLLLTAPIREKFILGLDPGFKNGCKYALIAPNGEVITAGKEILLCNKHDYLCEAIQRINKIIQKYKCEILAIGNGIGSRETETIFSDAIKENKFKPLKVTYCIVSESGSSVYSASEEAASELPNLAVELRGAVSIARRLQDPLSELIKIDPKVIGIGMYQHDVSESKLHNMADAIVEECVSFVGADVNVASEVLLRHIAGIGPISAKNIIAYREKNGPFINRHQLLNVPKIGDKKFEQCSGFLRIGKHNAFNNNIEVDSPDIKKRKIDSKLISTKSRKKICNDNPNPLDQTSVHPESYDSASKIIKYADLNVEDIGTKQFIHGLKQFLESNRGVKLIEEIEQTNCNIKQVLNSLLEPQDHDIRDDFSKPLFKSGITSIKHLKIDQVVTGKVMNVVSFGAFVDIGVNVDGLLHNKQMNPNILRGHNIQINDCIKVIITKVEVGRERISLKLLEMIN